MKKSKTLKIIVIAAAIVVLILLLSVAYVYFFLPNIPVEEVKVTATQERVERGHYLANHVTVCMDCHSTRDWTKFSGPMVPGTEGKGGEKFDAAFGFPGTFYSPNITPYNLSSWSDGEIYRAITSGVDKWGHPLFPIMPYLSYGKIDKEDILSLIAYLRSLKPIEFKNPPSDPDFPVNIILHTIPVKAAHSPKPSLSDSLAYGRYLVNSAGCIDCHTKDKKGEIIRELAFSGGREFRLPGGLLVSPNITPDRETGIGNWTMADFMKRFRAFEMPAYTPPVLNKGDLMTIMPWTMYAGMDSTDLKAVYLAMRTVKPISNKVVRWMPYR